MVAIGIGVLAICAFLYDACFELSASSVCAFDLDTAKLSDHTPAWTVHYMADMIQGLAKTRLAFLALRFSALFYEQFE